MTARNLLIRLAGYDPATLAGHSREDQAPIIHLGSAVGLGMTTAALNWAIGGYVFTGGAGSAAAVGTAALSGLIGGGLIAIIDRGVIYQTDTHAGRAASLLPMVAFRVALTCAVSSITANAVMPILLKPELELKSLQLIEDSERTRGPELAARYDLPGLQSAAAAAVKTVQNAQQAVEVVPPDIRVRLDAARACWSGYARRRAALVRQGLQDADARRQLAPAAAACARAQATAHGLLKEYGDRARAALGVAEDKYRESGRVLTDTRKLVAAKAAYAAEIEQRAITTLSSTVLAKLLATDIGARFKYWTLVGLIMALELLPLVAKLVTPKTVPGMRIATDATIAKLAYRRRHNDAVDEESMEQTLRAATTAAMTDALSGPEVHAFAVKIFATKVEALMPIEAFKMLMREIEARELDVQSAIRRHPSYARILTEMWRKTIDEVSEALRPYSQPTAAWAANVHKQAA